MEPFTAQGGDNISSVQLDGATFTVFTVMTPSRGVCMRLQAVLSLLKEQGQTTALIPAVPCICTAAHRKSTWSVCKGLSTCRNLRETLPWLSTRHTANTMHENTLLSRSPPICPGNVLQDASRTPFRRSGWHDELVSGFGRENPSRRIAHIVDSYCMSRRP